jgi:hypothetical protein
VADIVPADAVHVTAVFVVPLTVAVNCCVWPSPSDAVPGTTETTTGGFSVTVAIALFVASAALVAVIVAWLWVVMDVGAV